MRGLAVLADERERADHGTSRPWACTYPVLMSADSILPPSMSFICSRCLSRFARSITGGHTACWNSLSL